MILAALFAPFLASGPSTSSDAAALERALSGVAPTAICADVQFIASDELQGRDTPSHGQRLAARYLRARLERLGFTPGGDDGFFARYRMEKSTMDVDHCKLWVQRGGEEQELVFGSDYVFRGGGEHELAGGVVFVGSGSSADLAG